MRLTAHRQVVSERKNFVEAEAEVSGLPGNIRQRGVKWLKLWQRSRLNSRYTNSNFIRSLQISVDNKEKWAVKWSTMPGPPVIWVPITQTWPQLTYHSEGYGILQVQAAFCFIKSTRSPPESSFQAQSSLNN